MIAQDTQLRSGAAAYFVFGLLAVFGRSATASAGPLEQCASVKDFLSKGQVAQAVHAVRELNDLVMDQYMDLLIRLFPEKVGAFVLQKDAGEASIPGVTDTVQKKKLHLGNFATYKADGLPVMNAMFGSGTQQTPLSAECGHVLGVPARQGTEGPVKINERDAYVRKQVLGRFTATLCLKGGDVRVTSDSATKEQLMQFLKDLPAANLAKMEELFAPLSADSK